MQTRTSSFTRLSVFGVAAIAAGLLYSSRWVWEIAEGVLKNKQYAPTFVTQNFFLVKLLFILALTGVGLQTSKNRWTFTGILMACFGLMWTAVARTLEAYGAPGPWGLYSSPGLFLFFTGLLTAGSVTARTNAHHALGTMLKAIAIFYFTGSFISMLSFNLLGRDDSANKTASLLANILLMGEGISWIILGVCQLQRKRAPNKEILLPA